MFATITVLGLGVVVALGATYAIAAVAAAPKKRRKRFEQRMAGFQKVQGFTGESVSLGEEARGWFERETVSEMFAPEIQRVVLIATLGPNQKPFPFSLASIPNNSPQRRSTLNPDTDAVFSAETIKEYMAPPPWSKLSGNRAVFWAVLDGPLRAWLKKTEINLNDRSFRAVLTDEVQSEMMDEAKFMQHMAEQLRLAASLIEAVQQDNFIEAMGTRLAEQPHRKERLRMLDAWLRENDPQPKPSPALMRHNDCRHPEYWMLYLDNGGDPPADMSDACFALADADAQKILQTIIRRQPEARSKHYALAALHWPAHREAAVEILIRFEDPRLFPTIIDNYWQKPDAKLLDLIAQHQDPAIVALMITLLERGPRDALLPAINYLSRFGDRHALAPIINVRKQVPLMSLGQWEQAVNRMRRRLGPAPEGAGALSPVTPDPAQAMLERAEPGGHLTVPKE